MSPGTSRLQSELVRDQNLSLIMGTLLRAPASRKQLHAQTKVGSGTITRLVNRLLDNGYLEEIAPNLDRQTTTGRPEVQLRPRGADGRLLIGLQIQAKVVTADAFTLSGERVLSSEQEHQHKSRRAVIDQSIELTHGVIDEVGSDRILGVGVSAGGHVDFVTGHLISSPTLGWRRTDLRGELARGISCPIVVDNSVRSLAVERLLWSDWSAPNMLVVVVAGAISSAVVVDHALYRGAMAAAGDITHFPVALPATASCACGQTGCASSTLTDAALLDRARQARLVPGDAGWEALFTDGPAELLQMRRDRAHHLGRTLGHLMAFTDPDCVVIAGAIGDRDDISECIHQARQTPYGHPARKTPIRTWAVTEHEWSAGAAALLLDDFLRRPTAYDGSLAR
jgi:predicted NBD/HSP70 family sugar kinase